MLLTVSAQSQEQSEKKAYFAGRIGGELPVKDLFRATGLLILDGEKNKYEAKEFEIVFTIKGSTESVLNVGYQLDDEAKQFIGTMQPGDSMLIKSIKYFDGEEVKSLDHELPFRIVK